MEISKFEINFLTHLIDKDIIDLCSGWGISNPTNEKLTISELEQIADAANLDDRDARASEAYRTQDEYLYRMDLKKKLQNL